MKKVISMIASLGVLLLVIYIFNMCDFTIEDFIPTATTTEATENVEEIVFDEVYAEYEKNELAADDKYKDNRYKITGTIKSVGDGGINGWFGELSVAVKVTEGQNNYHLWCTFDEETQREALSKVTKGDTITFIGTCTDWANWYDCEIIE